MRPPLKPSRLIKLSARIPPARLVASPGTSRATPELETLMARLTKEEKKLNAEIERCYYANCAGTSISIMDIPTLYREAKTAHAAGKPIEDAVKEAIQKYNKS